MSFSQEVREELLLYIPKTKHCCMAELTALFMLSERWEDDGQKAEKKASDEASLIAKKCFTLQKKTSTIKYRKNEANAEEIEQTVLSRTCCKKSFLRGAFLAGGTMSHPEKSYHFEVSAGDNQTAVLLKNVMQDLDLPARVSERKEKPVVYIKEADKIVDALGMMGASVSLMQMENIRIIKEMRGNVNRRVNCETSNITRTVDAAMRQVEDIAYLQETIGLNALPNGLSEIAKLRQKNPQVSLQELGELLDPPLGKSGVNHRLRRISRFANEMRQREGIL